MPPVYPYNCPAHECEAWGKEIEVTKSVHQIDTPESCPVCGGEMTRQIALNAPPQFKGKGWARDGYS